MTTKPTYFTVQMSGSAPGGEHCIHLGRYTDEGGLGDNICKNSRHGRSPITGDTYGFSCRGGHTDPEAFACAGCLRVRGQNPRGTVDGMFSELFAPPKPPEPTGLGAVVEDADGNTYTRADKGTLPWFTTHKGGNGGRCDWTRWDDIPAVRVLSEGVQP